MTKILLVDDDDLQARAIELALRRSGFGVDWAADGVEGMEIFRRLMPDLVITDIVMPRRDGIGLISELRRIDPATPIIALSGGSILGRLQLLEQAIRVGANATMSKPVALADLLAAVRRCLATAGRPMPAARLTGTAPLH
ncbi:response regulator transcription factor [Marinibaculum pumilum]|uniref:Response regulator transcription factor n=1 Tax=Marinibaculum pumilum TaxID=1766165 RepID=A0ABV7L2D3_9PROT